MNERKQAVNRLANNFNISPDQMDSLLALAGKKMGKDPEKLREQMQSGQMDGILGGLSPAQRAQIQGFMNNPAAVQQFLGPPKVQQLLRGLMGRQ